MINGPTRAPTHTASRPNSLSCTVNENVSHTPRRTANISIYDEYGAQETGPTAAGSPRRTPACSSPSSLHGAAPLVRPRALARCSARLLRGAALRRLILRKGTYRGRVARGGQEPPRASLPADARSEGGLGRGDSPGPLTRAGYPWQNRHLRRQDRPDLRRRPRPADHTLDPRLVAKASSEGDLLRDRTPGQEEPGPPAKDRERRPHHRQPHLRPRRPLRLEPETNAARTAEHPEGRGRSPRVPLSDGAFATTLREPVYRGLGRAAG